MSTILIILILLILLGGGGDYYYGRPQVGGEPKISPRPAKKRSVHMV
jgi:hypothetical protein